ncbi:MAG TPA: heterodisulfide reductase-related iron-sulfur binding cluster [Polyangiales bacterium]|nr:heterodisulfide reductase-related iron-sulfur binding cluster [Polyangiales bacterium]
MKPEQPPTYDPHDERYWDPRDLEKELHRVFSICHGCRMCVNYCPSFPDMFERVDGYVRLGRGEIEAFSAEDYKSVNDLCYQCKLCYVKCPYTPDDGHVFQLDFPRLMLRQRAQRARRDGITIQDRALGEPQLLGKLGSGPAAPIANLVNANRLVRTVQEKTAGISAKFNLPPFARVALRTWFDKHTPAPSAGTQGEVVLFSTCTSDYNMPTTGIAAIQVLEHNGLAVHFPKAQTCCGMPNLDGGDIASAIEKGKQNVAALYPFVARGLPVIVPGPTCSYVLKKEYPELLGSDEAKLIAANTFDLMEFLRKRLQANLLNKEFPKALGKIAYHAACHLRAQKVGFPGRILLSKVPGTEVDTVDECSAVDGTWGMKAQYYELGRKYAQKLVRGLSSGEYDAVASDCPLSGLRIAKELGTVCYHPIELLNRAYGLPEVAAAGQPPRSGAGAP